MISTPASSLPAPPSWTLRRTATTSPSKVTSTSTLAPPSPRTASSSVPWSAQTWGIRIHNTYQKNWMVHTQRELCLFSSCLRTLFILSYLPSFPLLGASIVLLSAVLPSCRPLVHPLYVL